MAEPIGALRVDLTANIARFEKDMKRARWAVGKSTTQMGKSFDSFRGHVGYATRGIASFKTLIAGIALGGAIREVVGLADTMTLLDSRLKIVTDSVGELNHVKDVLFEIAQETRSAFESTATLYQRVARGRKELGKSTEDVLEFTRTIQQLTLVSGASSQEATNAVIQLSQGLASGQVRGEELRSVMEQLPAVAQAAARGMNMTLGQFREASLSGEVSAKQFFEAVMSGAADAQKDFDQLDKTVGQAGVQFKNQFMQVVDSVNRGSGATREIIALIDDMRESISAPGFADAFGRGLTTTIRGVADSMRFVGENIRYITAGIAAFVAYRAAAVFGSIAASVAILTIQLHTASLAMGGLTAAFKANPIGAIATAVSAAVAALALFYDKTVQIGDVTISVGKTVDAVWTTISETVVGLVKSTLHLVNALSALLTMNFEGFADSWMASGKAMTDAFDNIVASWSDLKPAVETTKPAVDAISESFNGVTGSVTSSVDKLGELRNALQFEIDQLGRGVSEQELYNIAKKAGVQVNDEFRASIGPLISQLQFLEQMHKAVEQAAESEAKKREQLASKGVQTTQALRTEQEVYNDRVKELAELQRAGTISAETYARGIDEAKKALDDASDSTSKNKDLARELGMTFSSAFEDAAVAGGELSDVLRGLEQDMMRLALRKLVTEPLFGAITGALPGFATGGTHPGGFRVVGERGPEIEATGPARYYSAGRSADLLRGDGGPGGVEVNVYTPPGMSTETRESQGPGGVSIDVIIDETVARNISTPGSRTGQAMRKSFAGVQRQLKGRG